MTLSQMGLNYSAKMTKFRVWWLVANLHRSSILQGHFNGAGVALRPDRKCAERLASLGVMGAQLMCPLKPLETMSVVMVRGVLGSERCPQLGIT